MRSQNSIEMNRDGSNSIKVLSIALVTLAVIVSAALLLPRSGTSVANAEGVTLQSSAMSQLSSSPLAALQSATSQ